MAYKRGTEKAGHDNRIGFAPIGRILLIGIVFVVVGAVGALSYGWSLSETREVTTAAIGEGGFYILKMFVSYSFTAAVMIQLMPQVLLTIRGLADEKGYYLLSEDFRKYFYWGALGFNGVDALTNIVAVLAMPAPATGNPVLDFTAIALRVVIAFGITWAEEFVLWAVGTMLHLLYISWPDITGESLPQFFRGGISLALEASGAAGTRADARQRRNR